MRITNAMVNHFVANAHSTAKAATFDPQLKIASGRRIMKPSDDMVAAERISHLDRAMQQLDVFSRTRDTVRNNLEQADNIMGGVAELATEAMTLAIQLSNDGSANSKIREEAGARLDTMVEDFVALANHQRPDGSYLFNGVDDQNPPYLADGTFNGTAENRRVELAPGIVQESTITSAESFEASGFRDAIGAFQTALNTLDPVTGEIDPAAIRDVIDDLTDAVEDIGNVRGRLGHRMNSMDEAESLGVDLEFQYLTERAQLRDVDLATEFTNLSASQTALEAVFETTKRFMQMNLGSFL